MAMCTTGKGGDREIKKEKEREKGRKEERFEIVEKEIQRCGHMYGKPLKIPNNNKHFT